jgi:hypothetical protein
MIRVNAFLKPLHGWLWSEKAAAARPLTTSEVLREEAEAIHHADLSGVPPEELYRSLNTLNSSALCLSGGGIRSAAFALGVMQALAAHPRKQNGDPVDEPQQSLLAQFHYLSTVSGGGHIGSWLSAWLARGFPHRVERAGGRPARRGHRACSDRWLRSYSNYLTPQLGLMSADTWAIAAVYLRNLVLNWLVILPVLCGGILLLKLMVVALTGFSYMNHALRPRLILVGIGILYLLIALRYVTRHRPSRQGEQRSEVHSGNADNRFIMRSLTVAAFGDRAHAISRQQRRRWLGGQKPRQHAGRAGYFPGCGRARGRCHLRAGLDFGLAAAARPARFRLVVRGGLGLWRIGRIRILSLPARSRCCARRPADRGALAHPHSQQPGHLSDHRGSYILISQWVADMVSLSG